MDIFEYLSVAISIVLAMGLATLLRALRDVLAPARRYWVHALWVLQVAFLHVQLWWAYWGLFIRGRLDVSQIHPAALSTGNALPDRDGAGRSGK